MHLRIRSSGVRLRQLSYKPFVTVARIVDSLVLVRATHIEKRLRDMRYSRLNEDRENETRSDAGCAPLHRMDSQVFLRMSMTPVSSREG